MGSAQQYLEKHQFLKLDLSGVPNPTGLLKYIVIIPAYCEPDLTEVLDTIKCCHLPPANIEVFILVNYAQDTPEALKEQNRQEFRVLQQWAERNNSASLRFIPLIAKDLPDKHAGAGLARKILMDEACHRFSQAGQENGIILSLDADSKVPANYFTEVHRQTILNPQTACFIFNPCHPVEGDEFPKSVYDAAAQYELHLRYYKNQLKKIGFPFYHYTLGSCFAVKASTYMKVGGMSRRKAGEDFYFLQKVMPVASTQFLSEVCIQPSPRPSWRVPFGTGPAIQKILDDKKHTFYTYHPDSFFDLYPFFQSFEKMYAGEQETQNALKLFPESVRGFLLHTEFIEKTKEARNNSASAETFKRRMYVWFDGLMVVKYLNYARQSMDPPVAICKAAAEQINSEVTDASWLLDAYRKIDNEEILGGSK